LLNVGLARPACSAPATPPCASALDGVDTCASGWILRGRMTCAPSAAAPADEGRACPQQSGRGGCFNDEPCTPFTSHGASIRQPQCSPATAPPLPSGPRTRRDPRAHAGAASPADGSSRRPARHARPEVTRISSASIGSPRAPHTSSADANQHTHTATVLRRRGDQHRRQSLTDGEHGASIMWLSRTHGPRPPLRKSTLISPQEEFKHRRFVPATPGHHASMRYHQQTPSGRITTTGHTARAVSVVVRARSLRAFLMMRRARHWLATARQYCWFKGAAHAPDRLRECQQARGVRGLGRRAGGQPHGRC
jgi:hypothetical protein